jgi:hypothetical protein
MLYDIQKSEEVPKRQCKTNLSCVTSQKTTEFEQQSHLHCSGSLKLHVRCEFTLFLCHMYFAVINVLCVVFEMCVGFCGKFFCGYC